MQHGVEALVGARRHEEPREGREGRVVDHVASPPPALRACSRARQVASGTSSQCSQCSRCDAPLRSTMPFIHARRTAVFAWKSSTTSSPARSSASACGPSTASIRAARTRKSSAVAISPGYGVAVRSSSFSRTVPGAADGASASVDLPAAILPQSRGA
ncbi:MAG: hypothetical protein O9972_29965, partial [Burkholderiales bacterium]|nr:hypothetical protein [Burkholderiales bacterium]